MKANTIRIPYHNLLLFVISSIFLIISCGGSSQVAEPRAKPGWINTPGRNRYVGIGEADSKEEARKRATEDALTLVRLDVHGGTINSVAEMSVMESTFENDETFSKFSKMTVSGYVKASQVDAYAEQDFAGNDIIFREYVLMAFDKREYDMWLLQNVGDIELLVQEIEEKASRYVTPPTAEQLRELFTYLEMASAQYETLIEVGSSSMYAGQIANIRRAIEKLVIDHVKYLKIEGSSTGILVNPFINQAAHTRIRFLAQDGTPIRNFPYLIDLTNSSVASGLGLTSESGEVVIERAVSLRPGDTQSLVIRPAVRSLSQNALLRKNLEIALKYVLGLNVETVNAEDGNLRHSFRGELLKVLDPVVFLIDPDTSPMGLLEGEVILKQSSVAYGIYYVDADVNLKFRADRDSDNIHAIAFTVNDGGKRFEQAAEHALQKAASEVLKKISLILSTKL